MWVIEDLECREFQAYNIMCYYIQYHQPRGYGVLKFEVGYLGLYALRYNCRLEYSYQEYYHRHHIVVFSNLTFAMTRMETIPNHVVSRAHADLEQQKQLMDHCHELTCFVDLGDCAMEAILWTKFQAIDAHVGQDALYLQAAILRTQHLVDKLSKQPCIGKTTHYHQCFPHLVKPN